MELIHPSAVISPEAILGSGVSVGPFAVVYAGVRLQEGVRIGAHSVVGESAAGACAEPGETVIGAASLIRSHAVIYAGVRMGEGCQTGHRVVIHEGTVVGDHTRIGTLSEILGHARVGRYCRFQSCVHVTASSAVGDFVWLFPFVVFTNDPTPPSPRLCGPKVGSFAVVATRALLMPGVRVGAGAVVAASAVVRNDVQPGILVAGDPARPVCRVEQFRDRLSGQRVYPWRLYFDRGMPWEGTGYEAWAERNAYVPWEP